MIRSIALSLLLALAAQGAVADSTPTQQPDTDTIPIALSDTIAPTGGTTEHNARGWATHGAFDGVNYLYGSDAKFLLVANQSNLRWRSLDVTSSWLVRCNADMPSGNRRCVIMRVSIVGPSGQLIGLELHDQRVCFASAIPIRTADVTVDDGMPTQLIEPRFCLDGAASAALQTRMLAGQSIAIKAYFAGADPVVDLKFTTYGLKQAMALRDWIFAQYRAGNLKTER